MQVKNYFHLSKSHHLTCSGMTSSLQALLVFITGMTLKSLVLLQHLFRYHFTCNIPLHQSSSASLTTVAVVTSVQPCCCRSIAMVTAVCQSQWGTRWRFLIWSDQGFFSSRGGGASEPTTCRKACWELHPLFFCHPSISQTSHLFSFLLVLLSQTVPPSSHLPILPQRAVYESRWIVGNKSSALQVLVINSVNWTSIIISLQRRDRKRKVWIFFFRL